MHVLLAIISKFEIAKDVINTLKKSEKRKEKTTIIKNFVINKKSKSILKLKLINN